MQTQSHTQSNSMSKTAATQSPVKASDSKSLTAAISEGLGEDVQKQIENTMDQASKALRTTKSYINEHRKEAIALAAIVGIGTWALLFTKPGRKFFDSAAPQVLPMISYLVTEILNPGAVRKPNA